MVLYICMYPVYPNPVYFYSSYNVKSLIISMNPVNGLSCPFPCTDDTILCKMWLIG
jgi:hypothetical protein